MCGNEAGSRIAEDGCGGIVEWLLEDDAGEIGVSCGDLESEIGAEIAADEDDRCGRDVARSGEISQR